MSDINVNISINNTLLTATVDHRSEANCDYVQYYFYLLKDGIVIDKKGWFQDNSFAWSLSQSGVYQVQGYARTGESRESRLSNKVVFVQRSNVFGGGTYERCIPAKVSIFGSCTTRDLFRISPSPELELKTYIARQSVISAISAPVPLKMEQIHLDSAFQRMAVWRDFNKGAFDAFREDGSDWLIVDFVEERFSPVRMGDSYVTRSSLAVQAGVIDASIKGSARLWNGEDFIIDKISLRSCVIQFAERLLRIYRPDHIIVHRARNVEQYWDAEGNLRDFSDHEKNMARMINHILCYMYDCLKECIPEVKEIDILSGYYGAEQHIWGKATVHYEDRYYMKVMELVKNYLGITSH